MFGALIDWTGGPVGWAFAVFGLGLFYLLAWWQYRGGRGRQRYDRLRERQRREYWGWE